MMAVFFSSPTTAPLPPHSGQEASTHNNVVILVYKNRNNIQYFFLFLSFFLFKFFKSTLYLKNIYRSTNKPIQVQILPTEILTDGAVIMTRKHCTDQPPVDSPSGGAETPVQCKPTPHAGHAPLQAPPTASDLLPGFCLAAFQHPTYKTMTSTCCCCCC